MDFKDYKKWFSSIFGSEATEVILDDKNKCIEKDGKRLLDFFKNYHRVEPIKHIDNGYIIKGCNECILNGIIVRKQDCPGFRGRLNEIKYVIIGLEANIPNDIHIAFNQFENEEKIHRLFTRLSFFLHDVKEKAYVTDIAKCRSSNLNQSRLICLKKHFFSELKMLLEFNPGIIIVFQGTTVENYFSKELISFSTPEKDEVKSGSNFLFKRQYLLFDNKKIQTILFPHGTSRTSYLWKIIMEEEVRAKIQLELKEFNFD